MNCKNTIGKLYDYSRNELSGNDKSAVENHLKECPSCAEELKKLALLSALFKSGLREPSPAVLAGIKKRLSAGRHPLFSVILRPALAMAAAVFLLAGVFLYPILDRKTKLSNTLIDDYNITETALYDDNAEFDEVSYIYGNDYDNEVF